MVQSKRFTLMSFLLLASSAIVSADGFGQSYPWSYLVPLSQFLRPISHMASQYDLPIKMLVLGISAVILALSLLAFRKSGSKRIGLIAFAFMLFALKAFFEVLNYYAPRYFFSSAAGDTIDLLVMLSMFVAVFYNRKGNKFFAKDKGK